jgi:glycine cleavage system H protein
MNNPKPKSDGRFHVIPEGDKPCIWMELGVVAYKICDRDFNCDTCPLDIGLRGLARTPATPEMARKKDPFPDSETDRGGKRSADSLKLSHLSRMVKFYGEDDRYFHPKHTWIQVETPNCAYVGIDNIVATVLGSIDDVSLPAVGQRVRRGEACCQVIQGARAFSILSPISGRVMRANEELHGFPDKLILDSLGRGWLFSVKPDDLEEDLKYCRAGEAVFPWYLKELEWLDSILANSLKRSQELLGQTMHDGGELSRNLQELLPPEEYRRLVLSFIGKPSDTAAK